MESLSKENLETKEQQGIKEIKKIWAAKVTQEQDNDSVAPDDREPYRNMGVTHGSGKGVRIIPGHRTKYTAEQFSLMAADWIEHIETHNTVIEVAKTNMTTGQALKMTKPLPPLIDSFIYYARISQATFNRYSNAKKKIKTISQDDAELFEAACEDVKEYCNQAILQQMAIGIIPPNVGKFYLVNNSRYADVSKVEHEIREANRPSWLTALKAVSDDEEDDNDDYSEADIVDGTDE